MLWQPYDAAEAGMGMMTGPEASAAAPRWL